MPDQDPSADSAKRTLSEIGHLFLSDVRERHTGGSPRPQRIPPGQRPEAPVVGPAVPPAEAPAAQDHNIPGVASASASSDPEASPAPPVTAVIATHLGGGHSVGVRQYARHLAARVGRVGLIELDGADVRITCFEPAGGQPGEGFCDDGAPFTEPEVDDPRCLAEAIEELDWDVQRWLLAAANPRSPEVRPLLGAIEHWTLLSTCDHDGVVSSYRAIKGLCEFHSHRPHLTVSLLDAGSEPEIARVYGKLASVCEQFLDWHADPEPAVRPAPGIAEHPVLYFRQGRVLADGATHWDILADLIARGQEAEPAIDAGETRRQFVPDMILPTPMTPTTRPPATFTPRASALMPEAPIAAKFESSAEEILMNEQHFVQPQPAVAAPAPKVMRISAENAVAANADQARTRGVSAEVLDIGAEGSADAIVAAVLARPEGGLVECPVRAPMCPSARLTIDRDRRVILLAVAREGLGDLRAIGQAYRWLIENRALIGMAVPQFAIDAHQFPRLRLLVDQADASAEILQPMLQNGHVTVQAYRRVRWGDRTGLLLDAA